MKGGKSYFSLESEATQVAWRNAAASRGVRVTYSEESGRRACEGILGHGNGTDIFFAGNFSLPLGGRWYVRWALRGGCRLLTTGLFRPLGQRLAGELATVRTLWLHRVFQFSSFVRLLVSALIGFYSLLGQKNEAKIPDVPRIMGILEDFFFFEEEYEYYEDERGIDE